MKILQLAAYDHTGGACIAAYRQHQALLRAGTDSSMLVRIKTTHDPTVIVWHPPKAVLERGTRLLRRGCLNLGRRIYPLPIEMSDLRSEFTGVERIAANQYQVVNLQHATGFIDVPTFLPNVGASCGVVITLHDMSMFTGGCTYTGECMRYTEKCGSCPQLDSSREVDFSRRSWAVKNHAYARLSPDRVRVVGVSRWISECARQSSLFGRFQVDTIPNCIDTNAFKPLDMSIARKALDLPDDQLIIGFGAANINDHRKGIARLFEALGKMNAPPFLLTWGGSVPPQLAAFPHRHLGHISNDEMLRLAYCATDAFVLPSAMDNLPNTVMEAMACGTPVVAFNVGGVPDLVDDGKSGLLAAAGDTQSLAQSIATILSKPDLRRNMAQESRRTVLDRFTQDKVANAYNKVYGELAPPMG